MSGGCQKKIQGTICILISPTEIMSPLHANLTDQSDRTASSFGLCLFKIYIDKLANSKWLSHTSNF